MKKIIITGVAGFIAKKIAQKIDKNKYEVIGIDINNDRKNKYNDYEFLKVDLSNERNISKLPTDIHAILHLGGQSSGEKSFINPIDDLKKNTVSTLNLINFSLKNNINKFLYASSMSVYGKFDLPNPVRENEVNYPLSCYGVGKLASENYLKVFKKNITSLSIRMFNVYGPGQNMNNLMQGMISIYLQQALNNKVINVKGSVNRYRDFIYIDDVVESWIDLLEIKQYNNYDSINLGTGVKTTVNHLLKKIINLIPNTKTNILDSTPGDQKGIYADISRLKSLTNKNNFITLEQGLKKFYEYERKK